MLRVSILPFLAILGACGGANTPPAENTTTHDVAKLEARPPSDSPSKPLETEMHAAQAPTDAAQATKPAPTNEEADFTVRKPETSEPLKPLTPDDAQLASIAKGEQSRLRSCLPPNTHAAVKAHFTIDGDGSVENVTIQGKAVDDAPEAQKCMSDRLSKLRFPEFQDPYVRYTHSYKL